MKKITNWIKNNIFWSVLISLAIFVSIGPVFFGKGTLNAFVDILPNSVQTGINAVISACFFYLCTMFLFLFGTGIYNVIRENNFFPQKPEGEYNTIKKIAHATSIVVGIILTYVLMFK